MTDEASRTEPDFAESFSICILLKANGSITAAMSASGMQDVLS